MDITTVNTYNVYGQPLSITAPNGTITTLAYDQRQRITSRQVGTDTTGYAYWPTGLLKTVTLPDGTTLNDVHDAAHRLTDISDTLGNTCITAWMRWAIGHPKRLMIQATYCLGRTLG